MCVCSPAAAIAQAPLDRAFQQFWAAEKSAEKGAAIDAVLATGASFETIHSRLVAGRTYSAGVPTGTLDLSNRSARGIKHPYRVSIPKDYDPARRYPVRFYLHGGVQRPARRKGDKWRGSDQIQSSDRITVFPSSWKESMWWTQRQAENLQTILDKLKRRYNVDENRVHLVGVSDGATGAWYYALRDPTPWAAYLPFIGHPAVLTNRALGVEGQIYPRNAFGQSFYVINGGLDPLYPLKYVVPYLDLMQRAGAEIAFSFHPDAGHDLSWWPEEAENIEAFIEQHPRDPLREQLRWETETVHRSNRNAWVLVTELGDSASDQNLPALANLEYSPTLGFKPDTDSTSGVSVAKVSRGSVAKAAGLRRGDRVVSLEGQPVATLTDLESALGQPNWGDRYAASVERKGERLDLVFQFPDQAPPKQSASAFKHRRESGRIEVERDGNRFDVRTQGVRRYRLLLSPEEVDFAKPVVVFSSGEVAYSGMVTPSTRTLLKWAAVDNDRRMLFAAELEINLPK